MSPDLPEELRKRLDRLRERLHGSRNGVFPIVGSGLSMPDLPSWATMLEEIIGRAVSGEHREELKELMARGRFLEVADGLEIDPGPQVISQVIAESYQRPRGDPPSIYELVAALPVTQFATTNYDPWLKDAVARRLRTSPRVFTPGDRDAFTHIRPDSSPLVLMLHGDADRPETCVLSQRAYRKLTHGSPAYRGGLAALASQRTLLFLGHSLNDPDLVTVLEEWIEAFDAARSAPVHAWLGAGLKPNARRRLLSMGVEAILYSDDPMDHGRLPDVLRYLAIRPGDETAPKMSLDTPQGYQAAAAVLPAIPARPASAAPYLAAEGAAAALRDATAALPQAVEDELVTALERCAALREAGTRKLVLDRLPPSILGRMPDATSLRAQVTHIVQTCARVPGGLVQLRDAVLRFEGASQAMAAVDEVLSRIRPQHAPLQPRVLIAGPGFGLDAAAWTKVMKEPAQARVIIEGRSDVARAQMAAIVRHDVIIDLSPWRAFARWVSIGFRDIETLEQAGEGGTSRREPDTVCYFGFPDSDLDPDAVRRAVEEGVGLVRARLDERLQALPELRRRIAEAMSRDGVALTGFPNPRSSGNGGKGKDLQSWAEPIWTAWVIHAAGLVANERPAWLPQAANFQRRAGRLDRPLADATREDYLRALRVAAGQVRLVGELHYRPIEDVFVEMEVEQGEQWKERRRRLARLRRERGGGGLSARKHPISVEDARAKTDLDAYDQLLSEESRDWPGMMALNSRVDAARIPELGARVFLEGEAGTGKSTLLRWLAVHTDANTHLPIWVELSRLLWRGSLARDIAEQAVASVELAGASGLIDELEVVILAGRAALFLDGLDEAADKTFNALDSRLHDEIGAGCRVVLSSRPQVEFTSVYTGAFAGVCLHGLVADGVHRFLRCYFGEAAWISGLLHGLALLPDGERWRRTPVLLALAATHVGRGYELPGDTIQLYDDVIRRLLEMAARRCGAAEDRGDEAYRRLAAFASERLMPASGERRVRFSRAELPTEGTPGSLVWSSGLFSGVDTVRFAHLTLGEFLAARGLDDLTVERVRARHQPERFTGEVLPMAHALAGKRALDEAFGEHDPSDATHGSLRLVLRAMAYGGEGAVTFARVHGQSLVDAVIAGLCPPSGRFGRAEEALGRDAERALVAVKRHLPDDAWQAFTWLRRLPGHLGTEAEILAWTMGAPVERWRAVVSRRSPDQVHRLALCAARVLDGTSDKGVSQIVEISRGGSDPLVRWDAVQALAGDEEARPALRELLRDPEPLVRSAAVEALAGDEEARPALREFLRDPEPLVRSVAVEALAGDKEARPTLRELLYDDDEYVRQAAVRTLAEDEEVRPTLRDLLFDGNAEVRQAAVRALANDKHARAMLRELLSDDDADMRQAAVQGLADDEQARPTLRELLYDPEPLVRSAAVEALTSDEEARPTVRELLRDDDADVRRTAANALAGDEEARPTLRELLYDPEPLVRSAAVEALAGDEQTRPLLRELLRDRDWEVREAAANALAGDEEARPILRELLRDDDAEVRRTAANALAGDEEGRPILRELLRDNDADVRRTAVRALAGDEQMRSTLRELLRDRDWEVREAAANALAGDEEGRPILRELLRARDWEVREATFHVLAGDEEGRPILRELLHDPEPWVRSVAVNALAGDEEGRPILRELLHDPEPWVRSVAVNALAGDEQSRPTLREFLHDPEPLVRSAAVKALAGDEQTHPTLRELLRDRDWEVREAAANALAGDEEARPILRELLRDDDLEVQEAAVKALAADEEARPALREFLHGDDWALRQCVIETLAGNEEARPTLRELLRDDDADVRRAAVRALAGDEEARPALRELLRDDDADVRRAAVRALAGDEEARPTLLKLLHDPDPWVQQATAQALVTDLQSSPHGQALQKHTFLRLALRRLDPSLDPMPGAPLSWEERLAEETLSSFTAAPRPLQLDREPVLGGAVLAWLLVRLGQISPLDHRDSDPRRPPVYGYLDELDASDGARIYLVHVAMDAQDLLWERDFSAVHNVLEAWRVGRALYTKDDEPIRLLLACADIDPDDLREAVRSLPPLEPGQVLTGPIFHGFELPRSNAPEARAWPELLFDSELGVLWQDLDETRRGAMLDFLGRMATDPRTQPWMLVPLAAALDPHLPPTLRQKLTERLPQASSEAAALLARARGNDPARAAARTSTEIPSETASEPERLRALIDAMRGSAAPEAAAAALAEGAALLATAPDDDLIDALGAMDALWQRARTRSVARQILAVVEGLSLAGRSRVRRKQNQILQSLHLFLSNDEE